MVKVLRPLGLISSQIKLPPEAHVPVEHASNHAAAREATTTATVAAVDPAAAAMRALEAPLNFPPLAQAVVPGDQLAIAIDEAVPAAADIVRGVIAAAEAAGIEPDAITIVTSDEEFCRTLRDELGSGNGAAPRVVVHDADDPHNLCLIGLTEKDEPLLVNRTIYEADVVLPIGCARLPEIAGSGVYDSLYPRFCDAQTISRRRTPSQRETAARRAAARRKAEEAGWLLGVPMVIQVVPGGGGSVAEVVAGESRAVAERCQQLCEQRWSFQAPRRASLVIATVSGGSQEQSWENIARALAATERLVAEGGAVAICSDLETAPGQSIGRLVGGSDLADVEREVRNDHSPDSWPAWQLARAQQRGPVYFLSHLDAEVVEEMGLAPIADMDELARLAGRHESCIVLEDSQHAVATVAGES